MAFKLENIEGPKKNNNFDANKFLKTEITIFGSTFNTKKKFQFYNELGILLKAGIAIRESLMLIKESQKKEVDRNIIDSILKDVVSGFPLSESMLNTKHFSEYEYHSIKIGEETGTLSKVSTRLAVFFERKIEQKRIIVSSLTYPAILIFTAIIVVIFMLSYVVPMFEDIFRQNKLELPFLTRIIIAISDSITKYGYILIIIIGCFLISIRVLKKNHAYKNFAHHSILKIPIVGKFVTKIYLAQFTQAISLLTNSKVSILTSIQMVKKMIVFLPLQQSLEQIEKNILQGKSLSESMNGKKLFDSRIVTLIKVAEETNQTDYIFNQLSEQYSNEVIAQSKTVSTFLEPFIILVIGTIIGVLLIAMYLPMFKLSSVIG